MKGRLKLFVINYLVRNLLKSITIEDLIQHKGRSLYVAGRRVSDEDRMVLAEEADALLESQLWKYLRTEMTWLSNLRMLEKAKTNDDMLFGKAMLYLGELQEKFLKEMRSL